MTDCQKIKLANSRRVFSLFSGSFFFLAFAQKSINNSLCTGHIRVGCFFLPGREESNIHGDKELLDPFPAQKRKNYLRKGEIVTTFSRFTFALN